MSGGCQVDVRWMSGGYWMDVCGVDAKRYPVTLPHVIAVTLRTPLRTPFNLNQSHAFISVTSYRYVMLLCRHVTPLRYAVTICRHVMPLLLYPYFIIYNIAHSVILYFLFLLLAIALSNRISHAYSPPPCLIYFRPHYFRCKHYISPLL